MTELLYYTDAYISRFTATVLSCESAGNAWRVVLDKTAFFPESGGQSADTGMIATSRVTDAKIKDGVVYHITDSPVTVGEVCDCSLDFEERFAKMQCHTAEHIISGLIHTHFGYDNVGFHLGGEDVTLDISAPLDRKELDFIEELANRAVFENIHVVTEELFGDAVKTRAYRSKLDFSDADSVRVVTVPGYDACACCAPHVSHSGEIGIIKLLDFCSYKGGVRIHMAAGSRALADYRKRYTAVAAISASLSAPQCEVAEAVCQTVKRLSDAEYKLKEQELIFARALAEALTYTAENRVEYLPMLTLASLREFSNFAAAKTGGILVALTGSEGDYKYVIYSKNRNLSELSGKINAALNGKGGGRGEMLQGSFSSKLFEIKDFFEKL
ncbi:MAG: hypothetical protein IJY27_07365 [Clostridia bacterium]|nr:hypothetical protein [Clostridia bacterium]